MNYDQLLRRFNSHLETAKNALCDWLNLYLPKISSNWWEECVADNLNSFSASVHDLKQLNLSVLLKILNNNWFALGNVIDLSVADRECVHDMMNVCSNWSASETTRTAFFRIGHEPFCGGRRVYPPISPRGADTLRYPPRRAERRHAVGRLMRSIGIMR